MVQEASVELRWLTKRLHELLHGHSAGRPQVRVCPAAPTAPAQRPPARPPACLPARPPCLPSLPPRHPSPLPACLCAAVKFGHLLRSFEEDAAPPDTCISYKKLKKLIKAQKRRRDEDGPEGGGGACAWRAGGRAGLFIRRIFWRRSAEPWGWAVTAAARRAVPCMRHHSLASSLLAWGPPAAAICWRAGGGGGGGGGAASSEEDDEMGDSPISLELPSGPPLGPGGFPDAVGGASGWGRGGGGGGEEGVLCLRAGIVTRM